MRRGWVALFGVVLIGVFAAFATVALAATNHWFSGTLTPGYGYASTAANSITYIEGTGNYNGFCVAKDQDISGYALLSAHSPTGTSACASSGGFASRSENGACCWHGWIGNGTSNDLLVDSSTHYSY